MFSRILTTTALIVAPVFAVAQDGQNEVSFRFGVGPTQGPGYFGDADLDTGVGYKFSIDTVKVGPISREPGSASGLGFGGSLRFIGGRDAADFEELVGLETIDPALEIGGKINYSAQYYNLFASLRYGAVGHKSFVTEIGGDMIYRPSDNFRVTLGPRFLWGDDTYASTYFGVTDAESEVSAFGPFPAEGGLLSSSARLEATYDVTDNWQVIGTVTYGQLRGDAADSPISESDEQISTRIMLTRKITFNF